MGRLAKWRRNDRTASSVKRVNYEALLKYNNKPRRKGGKTPNLNAGNDLALIRSVFGGQDIAESELVAAPPVRGKFAAFQRLQQRAGCATSETEEGSPEAKDEGSSLVGGPREKARKDLAKSKVNLGTVRGEGESLEDFYKRVDEQGKKVVEALPSLSTNYAKMKKFKTKLKNKRTAKEEKRKAAAEVEEENQKLNRKDKVKFGEVVLRPPVRLPVVKNKFARLQQSAAFEKAVTDISSALRMRSKDATSALSASNWNFERSGGKVKKSNVRSRSR